MYLPTVSIATFCLTITSIVDLDGNKFLDV